MQVNTFDVCTSGFERLRNWNEFIVVAYLDASQDAGEILDEWISDLNSCDMGIDTEQAETVIREWHAANIVPLFAKRSNPFNLEPNDDDDAESVMAFLYIEE